MDNIHNYTYTIQHKYREGDNMDTEQNMDIEQALLLQAGEAYKEIDRQAEKAQEAIERAGLWKPE